MRTLVLAAALLGLLVFPSALAGSAPPPAMVTAVYHEDGRTTLTWTPVRGAVGYVIYAGEEPDALHPVGQTNGFVFHTDSVPPSAYFGVSSMTHEGHLSEPHVVPTQGAGDCVSTTTELSFGVSLRNCLALVP